VGKAVEPALLGLSVFECKVGWTVVFIVGESVPTGGGFVAILGALVVGLEDDGFRDGAFDGFDVGSFVGLSGGNCVGAAVGGRVLACMGETDG